MGRRWSGEGGPSQQPLSPHHGSDGAAAPELRRDERPGEARVPRPVQAHDEGPRVVPLGQIDAEDAPSRWD